MSQLFSAILIGGHPNRGKSVLSFILSKLLAGRQLPHYLLRATPDGEGNWFQEAPLEVARALRAGHKRPWSPPFEAALEAILAERVLPLLVDAGGQPTRSQQESLFARCSHAILLGQDEGELAGWREITTRYNLEVIAEIFSLPHSEDAILSAGDPLRLRLGGLARHPDVRETTSPAWQALVARGRAAFAWDAEPLWDHHRQSAPSETLPVNVEAWYAQRTPPGEAWSPTLLPDLLGALPRDEPLAIYGARPVWLIAAIAAYSRAPLVAFDARYGWLPAPLLRPQGHQGDAPWRVTAQTHAAYTTLSFTLPEPHLTPAPTMRGPLPLPHTSQPLVLDGKLPGWLFAALACFYDRQGYMLAIAEPRVRQAIRISLPNVGHPLPL